MLVGFIDTELSTATLRFSRSQLFVDPTCLKECSMPVSAVQDHGIYRRMDIPFDLEDLRHSEERSVIPESWDGP